MTVSCDDIQAAARALSGAVLRTPALPAAHLAHLGAAEIVLKLECLQLTGSFKARGALYRLLALDGAECRRGVVAVSAGNHAQGVAWHARRLGIPATIVMPAGTPFSKVERTRSLGAAVVLEGDGLAEAERHALDLAASRGLTVVHPYDDPRIIAGQGTVALELLADRPDLDLLVVPVGGGGLISGIATAAKAIKPDIEILGVQAAACPTFVRGPRAPSSDTPRPTLAEGIAVKRPGALTRPIIDALVADVVAVEEEALEKAVEILMERQKVVAEGAGAAALAAVLADPARFAGRRVGLVVSGGNIDNRLMASILMRGLVRDGRLARLRIEIADAPGGLARAAALIAANGGNILEIVHQRLFDDVPVKSAEVDAVVETTDIDHVRAMMDALRQAGYPTRLLGSRAAGD